MEDKNKSNRVPQVPRIWGPGNRTLKRLLGPAIILLAAAVATAPILLRGKYCGDDFEFHAISWFEIQRSWLHGIPYPHWLPSANYGAGEPRFIFYPPLVSMLGAALGLVLPWQLVPIALVFILLAATGFATRALALQALPDAYATLASCAALFSGFTLFTAYERTAFAELSGGFWIPMLLLFALRVRAPHVPRTWGHGRDSESTTEPTRSVFRRAFDGSAAPMVLVVAGCWLSDGPLGIMASYLLAAVALAAALLARSWAPILRASFAATLGIALAAVYLIPAACEQHWIDLRAAIDYPAFNIENNWLFAQPTDASLAPFGMVLHRASVLAVTMIAIAVLGATIFLFRAWHSTQNEQAADAQWQKAGSQSPFRRSLDPNWWIPLALIPVGVLFLQFPISLPVWNLLPRLRFLQYPWRWVLVVEAPMAIFFAAAIWPRNPARRWRHLAVAGFFAMVFVLTTAFAAKSFLRVCREGDTVQDLLVMYRAGGGFEGTDEYEPADTDHWLIATGLPNACLTAGFNTPLGGAASPGETPAWRAEQRTCEVTATAQSRQPGHLRIATVAPHAGYMILRLLSYPAWRITVNGEPSGPLPSRDDGLIAVPVPQGPVELAVDWSTTGDVIAGRCVSCVAALLLALVWWVERKLSRAPLS
jgi:hypothetical protein